MSASIYSFDGFLPILCVREIYDRDVYFERVAARFHVAQKKRSDFMDFVLLSLVAVDFENRTFFRASLQMILAV